MIHIDRTRTAQDLVPAIERLFTLSAAKIRAIEEQWRPADGAPVFTVKGRYQARGWTEWTQGFQFGSALLQFDATGDREFLDLGRARTLERMAPHLTHVGVHDHGFNNVSTYGTLWRLAREGRIDASDWEVHFYELALKVTGAIQARRWTRIANGGFIYSFNGAHSLFVDTIRSLRALALGHRLGQLLMEEQDASVSLLDRLVQHAKATAAYSVYQGRGRDRLDVRGRVAHESLFNVANGTYRGPSTQQGYSPFTTWTRGLAWAMLGFAEEIEFLETVTVPTWTAHCSTRRAPRATTTSTSRPPTACRTGTMAHRGWRRWKDGGNVRRIRSTIASPWTAPRRRLQRKACCGWRPSSPGGEYLTTIVISRRGCASSTRCSTRPART
jgi:hypothetical protein